MMRIPSLTFVPLVGMNSVEIVIISSTKIYSLMASFPMLEGYALISSDKCILSYSSEWNVIIQNFRPEEKEHILYNQYKFVEQGMYMTFP